MNDFYQTSCTIHADTCTREGERKGESKNIKMLSTVFLNHSHTFIVGFIHCFVTPSREWLIRYSKPFSPATDSTYWSWEKSVPNATCLKCCITCHSQYCLCPITLTKLIIWSVLIANSFIKSTTVCPSALLLKLAIKCSLATLLNIGTKSLRWLKE